MPGVLAFDGTPLAAKDLVAIELNNLDHPLFDDIPDMYTDFLPAKGQYMSIDISECFHFLLLYIFKSRAGFPFHKHLPALIRQNA
eukprot:6542282-Ditylum_brightwellii.AAC.1